MRITDIIFEAGIPTAHIDQTARAGLRKALYRFLDGRFGDFKAHRDDKDRDVHDSYDAFYQHCWDNADRFMHDLCGVASKALTAVVREAVTARYGQFHKIVSPIRIPNHNFDGSIDLHACWVKLEVRERSSDPNKRYGGYFQAYNPNGPLIKCFVNEGDLFYSAMGYVERIVCGESENADTVENVIAPVFVHEYAHLEQWLRGGSKAGGKDHGYTTVAGGPKGNRRNPNGGDAEYLRYKGSANEIDSFASQAASEIIQNARRYSPYNDDRVSPQDISGALAAIAEGYGTGGRSVEGYESLNRRTMEGEFADLGFKPEEMTTVWNRFLKLVYHKLWEYREKVFGKSMSPFEAKNYPQKWFEWAKRGLANCTAILANHVAKQIISDFPHERDPEYLMKRAQYEGPREKAAAFLESYFFRTEYDWEKSSKIANAFTVLVRKRVTAMLQGD
jgi:hypothetical protein